METERIHNLIEKDHSVQETHFMSTDNSFFPCAFPESDPEGLFAKFKTSKTMLVGDDLKRPMANVRKLAVPPKKRKPIREESDSSDISARQNQEDHKYEEASINFCREFEKENLSESTSIENQKSNNESKVKFSLQSSVYVKADESAEWIRLKCFDSMIAGSNHATFFAGGPIQSSAFSIMTPDIKGNQYIAVAVSNFIYNNISYNNTKNTSGIIQFWNVGSVHEGNMLNQSPAMELALYHDIGIITQMQWFPADCYDKCSSTGELPILGLLAASSSDSYVYIYRVPQPNFMPKSKSTFPIYFTLPFMKLVPLFGEPSNASRNALATCINWEKNGERIVAGYGNGAVCVWMIKISSFASNITVKSMGQPYIIQPYLFFQASGASITSLSFAPFDNHRWLVVTSIDKMIRFYDLHDCSTPFHAVKQGFENSCVWSDSFCGVYSTSSLNAEGINSLFSKDCCGDINDKGNLKGLFDASTYVAVSGNKKIHAFADMSGTVTVNFLKNISKPLQTCYLTYVIFETEIIDLGSEDLELKTSENKISISGSISTSDTKVSFYPKLNKRSSSSSSGFCSPNHGKKIVIDTTQCLDRDKVNLQKSSSESSMKDSKSSIKDFNNNRIKSSMKKPLNLEEANFEKINCPEGTDLMRLLLLAKSSSLPQSLSHKIPFSTSNNFDCDSKSDKQCIDKVVTASPGAADYSGDTIIYPIEPFFSDTSHTLVLNSVKSNTESKTDIVSSKDKGNTSHVTAAYKKNRKTTLKTESPTDNTLHSSVDVRSGCFCPNENSSLRNRNYNSGNLGEINNCNCDCNSSHASDLQCTLTQSYINQEEYHTSKKSPKETEKNGDFQNLDTKDNNISRKDTIKPSLQRSLENPLCDQFELGNSNQEKSLSDVCSCTSNNICDLCDKTDQFSERACSESTTATDYSGSTIIYVSETDETGTAILNLEKFDSTYKVSYKETKKNTFRDTLLQKMAENVDIQGSKSNLLTENPFAREKYEHFLTKESLKLNSDYETATRSCDSSDEGKNFFLKKFLLSDFQPLHSEYLSQKSEKKDTHLKESPETLKNPQELPYENLIGSFGVIFKNNLTESTNPLKKQANNIYIGCNPLSEIKTISWDHNEGRQAWLFAGGNSGIGRLVLVPDSLDDIKKPHHRRRNR